MTLATGYTMSTEPPALDEYLRLRAQSGLTPRTPAQGAGAIGASLSWRTVREDATGEAVAMGRMIGDGTWYFHICDMATLPAHQRRGLGRTILDDLVAHIRATAPDDPYIVRGRTRSTALPQRRIHGCRAAQCGHGAEVDGRLHRPEPKDRAILPRMTLRAQ